jgi:hypothetical protein
MLADLVRDGLAMMRGETIRPDERAVEIIRVMITEAGEDASRVSGATGSTAADRMECQSPPNRLQHADHAVLRKRLDQELPFVVRAPWLLALKYTEASAEAPRRFAVLFFDRFVRKFTFCAR